MPHKLDPIPVLEVHTGFPFSKLDENWNGMEGRTGGIFGPSSSWI